MSPITGLLVSQVLLDIRHPAWRPVNPDGSSPALAGTGSNALFDWQPVAIGVADRVVGAGANTVTYRPDAGLAVMLSAYGTGDTIEDHSGDGDSIAQMVSHRFEVPKERTLDFDWTSRGKFLERLIWTVFDDPTKRPLEVRETYVDLPASGATLVNGAKAAGDETVTVDGVGNADIVADDLITIAASPTIYRVLRRAGFVLTLDKGLSVAAADNAVVARGAITKRLGASYLVQDPTDKRAAKGIMGMTVKLVPTGEVMTRTGLTS